MTPTFTIADLIADPALNTNIVSGTGGLDRGLLWAHSCEMTDPDKWLGPNELLMTIGLCIPRGARQQQEFIARLDDAGLAGIAIGDDGLAPHLTKTMLAEAEARSFPVLVTGPSTPFAAIGRTVAAANAERQTMSVLGLAKLYRVAGQRHLDIHRSGDDLSEVLGTRLTVVDDATGCVLLGQGLLGEPGARAYTLRTHRPTHLLIDADSPLDGLTLAHLSQILAVDANAIAQDLHARIADGAAALAQALTGRPDAHHGLLRVWEDASSGYRAIVTACDTPMRLQLALAKAGLPTTAIETGEEIVIIAPTQQLEEVRSVVQALCSDSGVSAEHRDFGDISGAVAEATTEFGAVRGLGVHWREFHGERISLVSRSRSEAAQIITTVLGPLAGSESRYVVLRDTLFAFLDHNMQWATAAKALGLHRQGLVYRLNQVEVFTGRDIRKTQDVSELWLARIAWRQTFEKR